MREQGGKGGGYPQRRLRGIEAWGLHVVVLHGLPELLEAAQQVPRGLGGLGGLRGGGNRTILACKKNGILENHEMSGICLG